MGVKTYCNTNRLKRVAWNLFLITAGATLISAAIKGIMMHHDFMVSGVFGTGLLVYYATGLMSPAFWYVIFCIPVGLVAYFMVSRRFFLYSIYAILISTVTIQFIPWPQSPITDSLLAVVAGSALIGIGIGLTLRSQGSDGGLSIISIALHQKFGMRIGQVNFLFNLILFLCALSILHIDRILYSIIGIFITTQTMEYVASMFNERKVAFIISNAPEAITERIMADLQRGVTLLSGKGGFTKTERVVLLTVVHNYQVKRLEEAVFSCDPHAFVIVENTFNVLGSGFSQRKVY